LPFRGQIKIVDDLPSRSRWIPAMQITAAQLGRIGQKEQIAVRAGFARLTRQQAQRWCLLHVGDDWYGLPLMLMVKGYNEDYDNFTEVNADSVYELEDSGCYIRLPHWWTAFELWRRGGGLLTTEDTERHQGRLGCSVLRGFRSHASAEGHAANVGYQATPSFRPSGASSFFPSYPRLTPWATHSCAPLVGRWPTNALLVPPSEQRHSLRIA
jgi:hypothetical protein